MVKDKKNIQKTKKQKLIKNVSTNMIYSSTIMKETLNYNPVFYLENVNGTIDLSKKINKEIPSFLEYKKIKKEYNSLSKSNKNMEYVLKKSKFLSYSKNIFIKWIFKHFVGNENYAMIDIIKHDFSEKSYRNENVKETNYYVKFDVNLTEKEKILIVNEKISKRSNAVINFIYFSDLLIKENDSVIINVLIDNIVSSVLLFSLFFEKVIVLNGYIILGIRYKKNILQKELLYKAIQDNYSFSIKTKDKNIKDRFIKYIDNIYFVYNEIKKQYIKTRNEETYVFNMYYLNYNLIRSLGFQYEKEIVDELNLFYVNMFKLKIYSKDDIKKIEANINSIEGNYITNIIKKYNFKKCFEVGFAHGISSIYILKNKGTSLISIDPFQKSQWDNQGLKFVKHLGYDKNHELIEKKSHIALPEMLEKYSEDFFDFCFIDGDHKFDVTLLDFYYSSLMIKIGGVIIIDDALHSGVSKCIKFIDSNMENFQKIQSPSTIAVYKKISEDKREWFYHKNF